MRFLQLFFFCLFAKAAGAQVVLSPLLKVHSLKAAKIAFDRKKKPEELSPFSTIVLKDCRQDTVTMGYVKYGQEFSKYFRLEMEKGLQSAAIFLNQHYASYDKTTDRQLLIYLSNFFLTQDYKAPSTGVNLVNDVYTSKAFLTAHLLVKEGGRYFHLGEADTVLKLNRWLGRSYNTLAEHAFRSMVMEAAVRLEQGRKEEIDLPVFTKRTVPEPLVLANLQEGFYSTYESFRQQKSQAIAVQFEQKKKSRIIKAVDTADRSVVQSAWGFVAEGVLYVRHEHSYISMQQAFGSLTGLGFDTFETYKAPVGLDPISLAVFIADVSIDGPTDKNQPYKLFRLNPATGRLE